MNEGGIFGWWREIQKSRKRRKSRSRPPPCPYQFRRSSRLPVVQPPSWVTANRLRCRQLVACEDEDAILISSSVVHSRQSHRPDSTPRPRPPPARHRRSPTRLTLRALTSRHDQRGSCDCVKCHETAQELSVSEVDELAHAAVAAGFGEYLYLCSCERRSRATEQP